MSLLVLMYHQIWDGQNAVAQFEQHLIHLKQHYALKGPFEALDAKKLNICLSFDDAYFDFYHDIYPLLKRHQCKAILAIPSAFIQDKVELSTQDRLKALQTAGPVPLDKASLCTWPELKEMVDSGWVYPASHSHKHEALNGRDVAKIETDVRASLHCLNDKLNTKVDMFVYPYGKMSRITHKIVRRYYQSAFRIGNASNASWQQNNGLLYRVDADAFWPTVQSFEPQQLLKWRWNRLWNTLRGI